MGRLLSKILPTLFLLLLAAEGADPLVPAGTTEPKPRVLFVNSYHPGYSWSDGITDGVLAEFNVRRTETGDLDQIESEVELRIAYMDCKQNQAEGFPEAAALKVKSLIESWNPDVVITADDIAVKYLITPYFKNSTTPFVFCGVNYDASLYGLPCSNVTGVIETELLDHLIEMLERFSNDKHLGLLGADEYTCRRFADYMKQFDPTAEICLVDTFSEWRESFIRLQEKVDIAFMAYSQSVEGWNQRQAEYFARENVSIPWGTWREGPLPYVLLAVCKDPTEQGELAVQAAKQILKGVSPADIPVTENKRAALMLNMQVANKLGIVFPGKWMQQAEMYSGRKNRILFINSYHSGYAWSDEIEHGFCKGLNAAAWTAGTEQVPTINHELRFFRMDSKRHPDKEALEAQTESALEIIKIWKPDLIITADDNAAKYLAPYLKDSDTPVLFCGINRSTAEYGLPTDSMRGMIEIDPITEAILMLKKYAKGRRIGFLGSDRLSTRKVVDGYVNDQGIAFDRTALVNSFQEWKTAYTALQSSVDMLILEECEGIDGWNQEEAIKYAAQNIRIPAGTTMESMMGICITGVVRVPEEQGWWCAKQARNILSGKITISDVAITKNCNNRFLINTGLAAKIGIVFPPETVMEATIYEGEQNENR